MKSYLIIILSLLLSNFCFPQQLTIKETVSYINDNLNKGLKLEIKKDRTFKIYQDISSDQYWIELNNKWNDIYISNNYYRTEEEKRGNTIRTGTEIAYSGNILKVDLQKGISRNNNYMLIFACNNNSPCYYISDKNYRVEFQNNNIKSKRTSGSLENGNKYKFDLEFKSEENRDKLFNAFRYLIESVKINPEYQNVDLDPFADENFHSLYTYVTGKKTKDEIQLKSNSGTYYILVDINGIPNEFVLDSGASEISISLDFERELISRGLITKEDYLEPALYRIADGSIIRKRRINLKEVKVGDFTINNVTASVGGENIPLLLGKSFLDSFSKWSIDNLTEKLTLEK